MTTSGDLGNYVKGFTFSPHKFSPHKSPKVPISPHLSPLVPKLVGKSIKIDSVVCFGITLHHILVKFPHFPRKIMGTLGTNGELRQRFYPESP